MSATPQPCTVTGHFLLHAFSAPLQVDELSPKAQDIIKSYTAQQQGISGKYATMCAATGVLPWKTPTPQDYETLLQVLHASWQSAPKVGTQFALEGWGHPVQ